MVAGAGRGAISEKKYRRVHKVSNQRVRGATGLRSTTTGPCVCRDSRGSNGGTVLTERILELDESNRGRANMARVLAPLARAGSKASSKARVEKPQMVETTLLSDINDFGGGISQKRHGFHQAHFHSQRGD